MLQPDKDPKGPDYEGESLKDLNAAIHFCAGTQISLESHEIVKKLLLNSIDLPAGVNSVKKEIKKLESIGFDFSALSLASKSSARLARLQQIFNISGDDLDPLTIYKRFADTLEDSLSDVKQTLGEHQEYDFDLTSDENEVREKVICSGMLATALMKYKLSFFIANVEGEHYTDISGAISTLTQPPKEYQNLVKKLNAMPAKKRRQFLAERAEEIEEKLIKPEEAVRHYTTLPPLILRAIILELDRIRADYVYNAKPSSISQELIVSILNNFENSFLADSIEDNFIKIEQDGYDINITWETPILSSKAIDENKSTLMEALKPTRKLLVDLGGDLLCEVDKHEIRMTITCPKQEEPDEALCELTSDNHIFTLAYGAARVPQFIIPLKISVIYDPLDTSKKFDLFIDNDLIKNESIRNNIASIVSAINKINQNHSLESVSILKTKDKEALIALKYKSESIDGVIDESTKNGATLIMTPAQLADPTVLDKLSTITQSAKCKVLMFSATDPVSTTQKKLEALQRAIDMSRALTYKTLFVTLDNHMYQEVNIFDSDNNLITNGIFIEKHGRFCGRCHSPELTERVVKALDEIVGFDGTHATKIAKIKNADAFVSYITDGLREHEIYSSEAFRSLLNEAVLKPTQVEEENSKLSLTKIIIKAISEKMSNDIIYKMIRRKIIAGQVFLSEHFGQCMGIDAPDSYNPDEWSSKRIIG